MYEVEATITDLGLKKTAPCYQEEHNLKTSENWMHAWQNCNEMGD